jgi:hypothetical protein
MSMSALSYFPGLASEFCLGALAAVARSVSTKIPDSGFLDIVRVENESATPAMQVAS